MTCAINGKSNFIQGNTMNTPESIVELYKHALRSKSAVESLFTSLVFLKILKLL